MAWGLSLECVVPHLTQHRDKADAVKSLVRGSSKWGESCVVFASRHVSEDIANCVTAVSVHSQMFHDPIETCWFPKECVVTTVQILTGPSLSYSCQLLLYLCCWGHVSCSPVWVSQNWQCFNQFLDTCPLKSCFAFNNEYSEKSSRSRHW